MPIIADNAARRIALLALCALSGLASATCGNSCPVGLVQRLYVDATTQTPPGQRVSVPCCGGSLFQDVDLSAGGIQQVDLANAQVNSGKVDAFLTDVGCGKLFDLPYNGDATKPLCKVYLGPVSAGTVSQRRDVARGRYRVFIQAWSQNDVDNTVSVDVGVYGPGLSRSVRLKRLGSPCT